MFHKNSQESSAAASFPLRHTTSRWRHGKTTVADDCCAGGHLEPWIVQSIQPILHSIQKLFTYPMTALQYRCFDSVVPSSVCVALNYS